jgi:hypothetical protein
VVLADAKNNYDAKRAPVLWRRTAGGVPGDARTRVSIHLHAPRPNVCCQLTTTRLRPGQSVGVAGSSGQPSM